jgi:hypothetical protein
MAPPCQGPELNRIHKEGDPMALGPVDVYIVGFPKNNFTGEIVPAIQKQVDAGVIRILDVLFVSKDANGVITTFTAQDIGPDGAAYAHVDLIEPGVLDRDDADEIADDLQANSSALLIAYENTWMAEVAGAFSRAGAQVIDQIRIPADVVNQAVTNK